MRRLLLAYCFVVAASPVWGQEPTATAKPAEIEFAKYVPEKADFFVHVNVPKLFASPMMRKAVPMAIEKHQDDILGVLPLLQNLGPGMPKPNEEQAKQAIKELTDPQKIAQLFDAAQGLLTDVVVTGQSEGGQPDFVVLFKCPFITSDAMELVVGFAGNNPQIKLKKLGKEKQPIYQLETPVGVSVYLTVPQAGLLQVAMSEGQAEASFAGKGQPPEKLSALIKQKRPEDFAFFAMLPKQGDDTVAGVTRIVLDKDLHVMMEAECKNPEAAAKQADSINSRLPDITGRLADESNPGLKKLMEKIVINKAKVDGVKVTADAKLSGEAVEAFLKK